MWTSAELERNLEGLLARCYHHRHPFNLRMHAGALSPDELRRWVANRYYYQQCIPVKDSLLLAKLPEDARREWITRVLYHDGPQPGEGGLSAWRALGAAVGLEDRTLEDYTLLRPGARFATDAYVSFVREKPWFERRGVLADRAVCPTDHGSAYSGLRDALPLGRAARTGLLQKSLAAGRRGGPGRAAAVAGTHPHS